MAGRGIHLPNVSQVDTDGPLDMLAASSAEVVLDKFCMADRSEKFPLFVGDVDVQGKILHRLGRIAAKIGRRTTRFMSSFTLQTDAKARPLSLNDSCSSFLSSLCLPGPPEPARSQRQ